jgi:hypothetical protein
MYLRNCPEIDYCDSSIFPARSRAIPILTGIAAGEQDADGRYPEQSINGRVRARLMDFAQRRAAFKNTSE